MYWWKQYLKVTHSNCQAWGGSNDWQFYIEIYAYFGRCSTLLLTLISVLKWSKPQWKYAKKQIIWNSPSQTIGEKFILYTHNASYVRFVSQKYNFGNSSSHT